MIRTLHIASVRASHRVVPTLQVFRTMSTAAQPSVVENAVDSYVKRRREREMQAPPVPVAQDELLIYSHGAATRRNIVQSAFGSAVISLYVLGVKAVEYAKPELALLNSTWTTVFAGVAAASVGFAVIAARAGVKYAVLTADGAHLRLYPYGSFFGVGTGKPVTVPIKLLRENPDFRGAKKASDAVFVTVSAGLYGAPSRAHLVFDKPVGLPLAKGPGSALSWTKRGLAPESLPGNVTGAADNKTVDALGLKMTSQERDDFRKYALLMHIVQGNPVEMDAVRSDDWELGNMKEQLDPTRNKTSKQLRADEIAKYWKSAKAEDGSTYWYHELTWDTRWSAPTVD